MSDYLHEGIDLKNTKIVWYCEDCGHTWDDDGIYDCDICPRCEDGGCTHHEHVKK